MRIEVLCCTKEHQLIGTDVRQDAARYPVTFSILRTSLAAASILDAIVQI